MIKLRKLDKNNRYYGAAIAWLEQQRAEFERTAPGQSPSTLADDYRDDAVKAALLFETHNKCAYCETKYRPAAFGDVEHILPRAADYKRQLDYDNLTMACSQCNNAKKAADPQDKLALLNPYVDNPGKYLLAIGNMLRPVVRPAKATVRARRTIKALKLNRSDLLEARVEVVDACLDAITEYENAPIPQFREYTLEKIEAMQQPDAKYSFIAREMFARHFAPTEANGKRAPKRPRGG